MISKDVQIGLLKTRTKASVYAAGRCLRVVVYPTGARAFVFRYSMDTRSWTFTIGHWPRMKLADARKMAQTMRAQVLDGFDPKAEYVDAQAAVLISAKVTVKQFSERWMTEIVTKARKSELPVKRTLDKEILPSLGRRTVKSITPAQAQDLIFRKRNLGRPAAAKVLRDVLKRLFEYAKACGLITVNPVEATPQKFVAKLKSRTRTLSEAELKLFFQRLESKRLPRWAAISLELLLLTMSRKSELRLARWEHLDLEKGTWEIPAELSKTGVPHIVYLSDRAKALLLEMMGRSAGAEFSMPWGSSLNMAGAVLVEWFAFPAQSSPTQPMAANALNKALGRVKWGIPHFTPHDLRRTASTILSEQGYEDKWIEVALNHSKRGIRGVYNRAKYAEQRKTMLEEWSLWLGKIRGSATS